MGDRSLTALLAASLIFIATYAGVLSERVHRTVVALAGAVAMIAVGGWLSFYGLPQAGAAIDFNTISLLLGMMLIVGILNKTGLFPYLAIRTVQLSKGQPQRVMLALGVFTALVSMVLDNVTTIMVVAPVTLSIAEVMEISPVPLLIGEAVLSNIGGVATLIGDPPNVLIGSAAGLSFNAFLVHLAPVVIFAWIITQLMLRVRFRKELRKRTTGAGPQLNARRALVDPKTAKRMLIILGATILLFLIHDRIALLPGMVALLGACAALLWLRPPIEEILREIHWDVLLFFVSLFIIVGGLDAAGTLDLIAEAITGLAGHGMLIAALAVLWISAIMSAVVDNIPFTIAMLPIIGGLAARGVNVAPLWWALALGVGFGGNGTPIGSTTNVVAVSVSERADVPITFGVWARSGTVAALISCVIASLALVLTIELGFF